MDVYIKEGRVYGLLKNRKILKLTLDNQKQRKFLQKRIDNPADFIVYSYRCVRRT